jgi:cell division initiation protein
MTQRMTEEMKESARREAALLTREAELQGEKMVEAARTSAASIQAEVAALKRMRRQLAEALRSTVEMYARLIDQDMKGDGEDTASEPA